MNNQILLTVIFSLFVFAGFGKMTEAEKKSWEKLDWLVRGTVPFKYNRQAEIELNLWCDDVLVSLQGNYTKQDSLELDRIIKEFNNAIPNRNIQWCGSNEPTLNITFVDLFRQEGLGRRFIIDYVSSGVYLKHYQRLLLNHKLDFKKVTKATLFLQSESEQIKRNNLLWSGFGAIIKGNNKGGFNIGNLSVLGYGTNNITNFDKFFFKTIYSNDFKEKYAIYLKSEYNLWEEFHYLTEADTKNTIYYSLQILIFLILTYYLYQVIWIRKLNKKIKNNFARFHITGLIFFVPQIIGTLIFIVPSLVQLQHFKMNLLIIILGSIFSLLIFFFIYLVLALIIYFIEHIIFRNFRGFKQRQLLRFFSVLFCFLLLALNYIILANSSAYILSSVQIFLLFIGFLLMVIPRYAYFYDLHQKEIIRKHQQIKIDKLEQLQTKFQLDAIQARTNPHFLYNSLNTIASLAKQDANKAEEFALKLSKLLRLRLIENPPSEISLTAEIETIKLYLEIEKERFGERFNYSVEIPEEPENIIIPSFILLHLVENAIKHGIGKISGNGKIEVVVTKIGETVLLKITDNGPDFPESPVYGTGIKNILEKLDILYPENYEFVISNSPSKFVLVTLNL